MSEQKQMPVQYSPEQIERIRADITSRYGLPFDRDLVPLIAEIMAANGRLEASHARQLAVLKTAEEKITTSGKTFQFTAPRQAFLHGFGAWGLPLLVGIILLFGGWLAYLRTINNRETERQVALAYRNLERNASVKQSAVNDSTQLFYLTLYPITDIRASQVGQHYFYDKTCNCIRVPLNFAHSPLSNK